MDIRSLADARERLAALEADNAGLTARADAAAALQTQLTEAQTELAALRTQRDERGTEAASLSAAIADLRAQLSAEQAATLAAQADLADARHGLQLAQDAARTVEGRAREMLAAQGGKPLAISDTGGGDGLTLDDLRGAMAAEKDPTRLGQLAKQANNLRNKR